MSVYDCRNTSTENKGQNCEYFNKSTSHVLQIRGLALESHEQPVLPKYPFRWVEANPTYLFSLKLSYVVN